MFLTVRVPLVAAVLSIACFLVPGNAAPGVWISLLVVNLALVLIVLGDILLAPSIKNVSVTREHPPVAITGSRIDVTWRISTAVARSVRVGVADALPPSLQAATRRVTTRVPRGGTAAATTVLTPTRRGRFLLDEVTVRTVGPLGLGGRQGRQRVRSTLRVHPPFRSRKDAELRIRRARILDIGLRSSRGLGGGTEFEQLREYTSDDEFRNVDWAASARAGRMIVKTYRPERNQTIIVMLDSGRLMAAQSDGVPRIEHAMDAVMALGAVATKLGDKVGLMVFDTEVRSIVAPARNRDQVSRMTEAMFDIEPQLATSDYGRAFSEMLVRFRRRSLVVLLTELSEQAVEDALLPALPLVARHHVVIVASVSDGEVRGWLDGSVADPAGAYRRAAAVIASEERRRAGSRLKSRGVRVIDAPPGALAAQLADAYLHIKTTGAL